MTKTLPEYHLFVNTYLNINRLTNKTLGIIIVSLSQHDDF